MYDQTRSPMVPRTLLTVALMGCQPAAEGDSSGDGSSDGTGSEPTGDADHDMGSASDSETETGETGETDEPDPGLWRSALYPEDWTPGFATARVDSFTTSPGRVTATASSSRPWRSQGFRSGAGHSATQNVIWNASGGGTIRSFQFGWGYVIGTDGLLVRRLLSEAELFDSLDTEPEDWLEGEDPGATLTPASLYEDRRPPSPAR